MSRDELARSVAYDISELSNLLAGIADQDARRWDDELAPLLTRMAARLGQMAYQNACAVLPVNPHPYDGAGRTLVGWTIDVAGNAHPLVTSPDDPWPWTDWTATRGRTT